MNDSGSSLASDATDATPAAEATASTSGDEAADVGVSDAEFESLRHHG